MIINRKTKKMRMEKTEKVLQVFCGSGNRVQDYQAALSGL